MIGCKNKWHRLQSVVRASLRPVHRLKSVPLSLDLACRQMVSEYLLRGSPGRTIANSKQKDTAE